MRKLRLTGPAKTDLKDIYRYSESHYGSQGAKQYDEILAQSVKDVRLDPYRNGSKECPHIGEGMRSYHTRYSRDRSGSSVKNPKHMVIFYLPNEDELAVSRILHESRDVEKHIPEKHKEQAKQSTYERPKINSPSIKNNEKDKGRGR